MNTHIARRTGVLFLAGVLALAGCQGERGPKGERGEDGIDGTPGTTGPAGWDATQLAKFTGTVTSGGAPVKGVKVTTAPSVGSVAVTDTAGKYTVAVPPGTYAITFNGDNLNPVTVAAQTVGISEVKTLDQVMVASALQVTLTVPDAVKSGGPTGFSTAVPVSAAAVLDGQAVQPDSVTWTVLDYYGVTAPPGPAAATPATGAATEIAIPTFEEVRQGANAWLRARWGMDPSFEYVSLPERDDVLAFGTQQVRAMSFTVKATVKFQDYTVTKTAVLAPVTIMNASPSRPKGMMVVANTKRSTATPEAYAWKLFKHDGAAYVEVTGVLQGADTRNPWFVPTESAIWKLQEANGQPIEFRTSTYVGAPSPNDGTGLATGEIGRCASCHNGAYALDAKFAEWERSAHANFNWKDPFAEFLPLAQFGLDGGEGPRYVSSDCIACHSVGYSKVPTADNGGLDDVMRSAGFTFPTPAPGVYDALAPAMKRRANIQCENCHGPSNGVDHASPPENRYGVVAPLASWDSGVCITCHDAFTHHDRSALWIASGHSGLALAQLDAAVENRPVTFNAGTGTSSGAVHCARCHAAQGFAEYLSQKQGACSNVTNAFVAAGNIQMKNADGTCTAVNADNTQQVQDWLAGKGVTVAKVQPVSCQTCHDPHSTELRLAGDSGVTAAGFEVKGAGAGALCITCHNSRNGAVFADSDITRFAAPHVASQADVFAGRNAYFFGKVKPATTTPDDIVANAADLPNVTAHAFMSESCADCHVKWVPEDVKAQFQVWNTNHTFRSSKEVCAECHGANIGELVEEATHEKLVAISNELGLLFRAKFNATGGVDVAQRYVVDADGAITDELIPVTGAGNISTVQRVELSEFHGQPALVITLQDGTRFGNNVTKFFVPGTTTAAVPVDNATTKIVAKAFYNYLLVHGDGTHGMHNPAFVKGVLDATLTQLGAVTALP